MEAKGCKIPIYKLPCESKRVRCLFKKNLRRPWNVQILLWLFWTDCSNITSNIQNWSFEYNFCRSSLSVWDQTSNVHTTNEIFERQKHLCANTCNNPQYSITHFEVLLNYCQLSRGDPNNVLIFSIFRCGAVMQHDVVGCKDKQYNNCNSSLN